MKLKKLFALALAVCMMVSVMPTSFAGTGFLSLDGVQPTTTTSGPSLTLDNPGTVSGGSVVTPSLSQSSQSVYTPDVYSNPYGVNAIDEEGEEEENTPVVADPYVEEDLAEAENNYTAPSLDGNPYTLSNTIAPVGAANMEPADPNTSDKITIGKVVKANDDGTYTINLNASTASDKVNVPAPGNIVLVLDASESMKEEYTINGERKTKAAGLEAAVKDFLDDVPAGSNVAIIGYGDSAYCHTNNADLSKAFLPVDTQLEDLKTATENVRKATMNGTYNKNHGKYTNLGLKMAAEILQTTSSDLPAVVVLFTDGAPSANLESQAWWENTDYAIAQEALHWSTILKADKPKNNEQNVTLNYGDRFYTRDSESSAQTFEGYRKGCKATLYSIAINLPERNIDTECGWHSTWNAYMYSYYCDRCTANEFLWRASSESLTSANHDGDDDWSYNYSDSRTQGGYYLAGQTVSIDDLFGEIEVETGLTLGDVIVKDVLPAYLDLVNPSAYNATTDASGKTTVVWEDKLVAGKETVSQTLTVKFKDGFLGGHSVPTNDAASGIYVKDSENKEVLAAAFGIPTVNVPIPEFTVTAADKNIYLSKELTDAELLEGVKATYDVVTKDNDGTESKRTFTIDPKKSNFGLASWQTAYTKSIEFFVVKDAPTDTLGCTITPNDSQAAVYPAVTKTDDVNITVFKPHITFNDSTIYLGNWAYFEHNHEDDCVSWKNASGLASDATDDDGNKLVTMTGDAPAVKVVYSVDQNKTGKLTQCTPVAVSTVFLGKVKADTNADSIEIVYSDTNYAEDTTFWNKPENGDAYITDRTQFTVHIAEPTAEFQDSTIYLGQTPNDSYYKAYNVVKESGKDKITWEHTGNDTGATDPVGAAAKVECEFTPDPNKAFSTCTPVDVTVFSGGLESYKRNDAFEVHVVEPTITSADATIYLSNLVNLNGQMNDVGDGYWYCDHTGNYQEKLAVMNGDTRVAPGLEYTFTVPENAAPVADKTKYLTTNCVDVTVSAEVIGDNNVRKPAAIADDEATFKIHVVKPTITSEDIVVYLSNPVDLNGQMTESLNKWGCDETGTDHTELDVIVDEVRKAPDLNYIFAIDNTKVAAKDEGAYLTADCVDVSVAATATSKTLGQTTTVDAPIVKDNKVFAIHILKPGFDISCTDLWADYLKNVELDGYDHITLSKVNWSDMTEDHTKDAKAHETKAKNPGITVNDLTFTFDADPDGDGFYKLEQTTDKTVSVQTASWAYKLGEQNKEFTQIFEPDPAFTIHVNKFGLTIEKTWDNLACYAQDAIFTLKDGIGDDATEITKVVIGAPVKEQNGQVVWNGSGANKNTATITIKGLLCGQDYSVTEDTGWIWRWGSSSEKSTVTKEETKHDEVFVSDPHTLEKPVPHAAPHVSFINKLIDGLGNLWFSFCTFVENVFAALTSQEGGNF